MPLFLHPVPKLAFVWSEDQETFELYCKWLGTLNDEERSAVLQSIDKQFCSWCGQIAAPNLSIAGGCCCPKPSKES